MSSKIVAAIVATLMMAVITNTSASAQQNYRTTNSPIRVSPQPVPPPQVRAPPASPSGGPTVNPAPQRPQQFGGGRTVRD